MANYHLEIRVISRKKGLSVTSQASYISGHELSDSRTAVTYHRERNDVSYCRIFHPAIAPSSFDDLQQLCNQIEAAEIRKDARTAREFIGSLPNELSLHQMVHIVCDFVENNFVNQGLCAIVAIHSGLNKDEPSRNNPHVHIIVPTRTVDSAGFSKKKDREHDNRKYIAIWREQWAMVQNRAYERNGLDIRISHERLEVQGKRDREPTIHLSRIDWQREQQGERTHAGDEKRAIEKRNQERNRQRDLERDLTHDLSR